MPALAAAGNAGDNVLVQVTVRTSVSGVGVLLAPRFQRQVIAILLIMRRLQKNTTVNAGADVALVVTGPASAQSGSTVTYVYTLTNIGPDLNQLAVC